MLPKLESLGLRAPFETLSVPKLERKCAIENNQLSMCILNHPLTKEISAKTGLLNGES